MKFLHLRVCDFKTGKPEQLIYVNPERIAMIWDISKEKDLGHVGCTIDFMAGGEDASAVCVREGADFVHECIQDLYIENIGVEKDNS